MISENFERRRNTYGALVGRRVGLEDGSLEGSTDLCKTKCSKRMVRLVIADIQSGLVIIDGFQTLKRRRNVRTGIRWVQKMAQDLVTRCNAEEKVKQMLAKVVHFKQ